MYFYYCVIFVCLSLLAYNLQNIINSATTISTRYFFGKKLPVMTNELAIVISLASYSYEISYKVLSVDGEYF